MKNILLAFLRHSKNYRKSQVATKIELTYQQYVAIESGEELMGFDIAKRLGKLYGINSKYLYGAAEQLDLNITRGEVIKDLKAKNKRMEEMLKDGYELLHCSKQKASSHENSTDCRPVTN